jgi:hypothetical protein
MFLLFIIASSLSKAPNVWSSTCECIRVTSEEVSLNGIFHWARQKRSQPSWMRSEPELRIYWSKDDEWTIRGPQNISAVLEDTSTSDPLGSQH